MKKLKVIIKIMLFFAIFIGAQSLIKYMILDDTMTISRVMMHDLYTEEQNIDILFCGASHCQLGFDTEVTDAGFGQNTFNAGSSSQGLETTLALIKETAAHNDLKQVYVDLDYSIVTRSLPNLESIYIVSDYMKLSSRKIEYLLNATSFEYYINSFMPLHKGRGYITNPEGILNVIRKKLQPGYFDYTEIDSSYAGKGHIASRTVIPNGSLWSQETPEERNFAIPENQQKYLREIISFCRENNIQLTFVSVPVTDFHLAFITNYDEYVNTIKDFLSEYSVEYYDFNLCNREVLGIDQDCYFNDDNHLNEEGAKIFCKIFADFFMGRLSEDELFYGSLQEKQQREPVRVLGVEVHRTEEGLEVKPVISAADSGELSPVCKVVRNADGYTVTVIVDNMITNQVEIKDEELR